MRIFVAIFTILSLFQEVSAQNILHCLGSEEMKLHKSHRSGPIYKLNQYFVTHMAGLTGINLKIQFFNKTCNNQDSPSLKLLEEMIINKTDIFNLQSLAIEEGQKLYQKAAIQALVDSGPKQLFDYISGLQANAGQDPHCLEREVPEIAYFMNRYMYLQGEIKTENLLDNQKKIRTIFQKLKSISTIYQRCARRKN